MRGGDCQLLHRAASQSTGPLRNTRSAPLCPLPLRSSFATSDAVLNEELNSALADTPSSGATSVLARLAVALSAAAAAAILL